MLLAVVVVLSGGIGTEAAVRQGRGPVGLVVVAAAASAAAAQRGGLLLLLLLLLLLPVVAPSSVIALWLLLLLLRLLLFVDVDAVRLGLLLDVLNSLLNVLE